MPVSQAYGFTANILLVITILHTITEGEELSGKDVSQCQGDACEKDGHKEEFQKYSFQENFNEDLKAALEILSDKQLQYILKGLGEKSLDVDNVVAMLDTGSDSLWKTELAEKVTESTGQFETELNRETLKETIFNMLVNSDTLEDGEEDVKVSGYEFPTLSRISPGEVGDRVQINLDNGHALIRITRSVSPPVFEIPNFLSDDECTLLINSALKAGLNVSNLFGSDIQDEFEENLDLSEISRVSEQAWLHKNHVGAEFWDTLQHRLSKLTELPLDVIRRGEPIQVVSYTSGGHYHAHLDTTEGANHLPCCFQTHCGDRELTPQWAECCRLCRLKPYSFMFLYITVLYYLSDVEEGGETAFPLADLPEDIVHEKFINIEGQDWYNLSKYCYNSSLLVRPTRGTAVMWYNHFVDEQTGYLGGEDRRSHHGGCDLIKGAKWIANNWISGTTFQDRFKPGVFYTGS